MSANSLIQKQHEIIQRSHNIINEFERGKADVEARFKRDKETAESIWRRDKGATEAAWKREKETTERNWNSLRTEAENAIRSIRNAGKPVQNALSKTKWQDKLSSGTPRSLRIPTNSSFSQQMAIYQLAA